jgi:hypothetical protein
MSLQHGTMCISRGVSSVANLKKQGDEEKLVEEAFSFLYAYLEDSFP